MPKPAIVHAPNGQKMAVIRPSTPELRALAIQLAMAASRTNDSDLFQSIPKEVGSYTFLGFLARTKRLEDKAPTKQPYCVVDGDGHYVSDIEPGDSFVGYDDFSRHATPVGGSA